MTCHKCGGTFSETDVGDDQGVHKNSATCVENIKSKCNTIVVSFLLTEIVSKCMKVKYGSTKPDPVTTKLIEDIFAMIRVFHED